MGEVMIMTKEWMLIPEYGYEKGLMQEVADTVLHLFPNETRIADVRTVVAEACINAIEHGSDSWPMIVRIELYENKYDISVVNSVSSAKLQEHHEVSAAQRREKKYPRGWGLLFIRELTDHAVIEQRNQIFHLKMTYYVEGGIR